METTKEEHINHVPSEIESVEARIAELEDYKIELEDSYNKLKLELSEKNE
jgi:hypothetical protein